MPLFVVTSDLIVARVSGGSPPSRHRVPGKTLADHRMHMEHCKGFLRGLKFGAFVAPLLSILLVVTLDHVRPRYFFGELGYLPDLVTQSFLSLPFTCLIGGLLGAVSDYRRDRSPPQQVVVLLLSLPTILVTLLFFGTWMMRFLGRESILRWLFEHGIWWKGMV